MSTKSAKKYLTQTVKISYIYSVGREAEIDVNLLGGLGIRKGKPRAIGGAKLRVFVGVWELYKMTQNGPVRGPYTHRKDSRVAER